MKKIILAAAIAALASMSVIAFASADVARYQPMTETLVLSVQDAQPGNTHTFTITVNPCDNSFTGTGSGNAAAGGATESISGTLVNGTLKFTGIYDQNNNWPGYTYTFDGQPGNVVAFGGDAAGYHAIATLTPIGTPTYKNHGDYVSSQGGGSDAAHSCIGMPIH